MAGETGWISPVTRLFWATGFCGGLSTLSALAYETVQFARSAEWFLAGLYLLTTLLGSFIAFGLGSLMVIVALKGWGVLWN